MGTKITADMVREAYRIAKRVYDQEVRLGEGVADLVASCKFNKSSAGDAINNVGHMLRGRVYHRRNSLAATEHYLRKIHEDYGTASLRDALASLDSHLDYYARLTKKPRGMAWEALQDKFSVVAHQADADRGRDGLTTELRTELDREERRLRAEGAFDPTDTEDARRRVTASIVTRQGQGEFRSRLLENYGRRCAVSGCGVEAVLEAAHVTPYLGPRTNHPANGLLLRADLHTLFDLELVAIDTASMTVLVSPKLDGSEYAAFRGVTLRGPSDPATGPDAGALDRHRRASGL